MMLTNNMVCYLLINEFSKSVQQIQRLHSTTLQIRKQPYISIDKILNYIILNIYACVRIYVRTCVRICLRVHTCIDMNFLITARRWFRIEVRESSRDPVAIGE